MNIDPPWCQPRTLTDFGGLEGLRPAERKLLEERDTGLPVVLGDGMRPRGRLVPELQVRPAFLRWVILGGGDSPPSTAGLDITGAFIADDNFNDSQLLDLSFQIYSKKIKISHSAIKLDIDLSGGSFAELDLSGCEMQALNMRGAKFSGGVILEGAILHKPFLARDAEIGRLVDLDKSLLIVGGRDAVVLERARVKGSVHMRDATIKGTVRMNSARVGGNITLRGTEIIAPQNNAFSADRLHCQTLNMQKAKISGRINIIGSKIDGSLIFRETSLSNPCGDAISADSAQVSGTLFCRDGTRIEGRVKLSAASFGRINDEIACWPRRKGDLSLDGCRYGSFTGHDIDAPSRIAWLDRQNPEAFGRAFQPQPWEECAAVLRTMGHAGDARTVLIAKEVRQRRARRHQLRPPLQQLRWLWDGLLRVTVAYGRMPMMAFAWLAVVTALGTALFWDAERNGALRPNDPGAIAATAWQGCIGTQPSRLTCWRATPAGRDWPEFQPVIYSLDLALPVVDLQMARWWTPDETADWPWAAATRWWKWVQIGLGWALSLLAVAGFSGIVKSD
jgi:hypothetical protein